VGSGALPQSPTILVHFQGEGTLLVAFKMHGLKHRKMAFLYVFMKKFSNIIVRVQAIEDPHNQITVMVRTCGPSRDRRLWSRSNDIEVRSGGLHPCFQVGF